ncbi:hypothetical protein [Bradyrhizobium sp. OK095]|uniref:hypothetical protein n=1 Tax=Bradyrhizobium sp. OK095 TaxID=1882760 RepID=UPI0008BF0497|nr:hypothetical protein [Bradyrhizobium sp. OK095]SEO02209.1 hypothetical protein SAMN05443254_1166 [Bradyrhizobium sp. OK095]
MTENASANAGEPKVVDVELFIVHPTLSPAEISAALGLEGRGHRVGDPRITPKGRPLEGTYQDTRWRHSTRCELTDQWFVDKIVALIEILTPHKQFLRHVRATGGEAQIIVQFLSGYLSDTVPIDTLSAIVDLHLDFGIEVFNVPQSSRDIALDT